MIGQKHLLDTWKSMVDRKCLPRFIILVGEKDSGRRTVVRELGKYMGAITAFPGTSVDDIRHMISDVYRVDMPIIYIISNGDNMSIAAKNALLKVTEEPPRNAYFVLTLTSEANTLDTIRSRGTVFNMDPYTLTELFEFYHSFEEPNFEYHDDIVSVVCNVPGDIKKIYGREKEFYSYVKKVADNIFDVSDSNVFKIADKIKLKESDSEDKYDLKLFWRAFIVICIDNRWYTTVRITYKYLADLRIASVNKASTFDMWLLDIREDYEKWNSVH